MGKMIPVLVVAMALAGCSMDTRPLASGSCGASPTTQICYSSWLADASEVRAVAEKQCQTQGLSIRALSRQEWAPIQCGLRTPMVATFTCGRPGEGATRADGFYRW